MSKLTTVILYKATDTEQSMIEKRNLEKLQRLEEDILLMPQWKDLCWSKSGEDSSCNDKAMVSALSFLKAHGIDDVKAASQEQIDKAFYDTISNDKYWEDQNM